MQIALDATARDWRDRAFKFATEELIPFEVEAELHEGRLAPEIEKRHKKLAIELGFSAMDVPRSRGGRQARIVDQVAVWEQLGRVTNALCWCFSEAQSWMFEACSEEQIQQFILPLMSGARKECYAITESGSGSDVSVETTARRAKGGYSIDGEKWYVTSANHADYFILQARLVDGPHAGSDSLFFIDTKTPGIEILRTPLFSHTFSAHHPTYRFKDVFVPESQRLGPEGDGIALFARLVPARAAHDRRAMLRSRRATDRGGNCLREHPHYWRRAARRKADGAGDACRQRDRALGCTAHHLRGSRGP